MVRPKDAKPAQSRRGAGQNASTIGSPPCTTQSTRHRGRPGQNRIDVDTLHGLRNPSMFNCPVRCIMIQSTTIRVSHFEPGKGSSAANGEKLSDAGGKSIPARRWSRRFSGPLFRWFRGTVPRQPGHGERKSPPVVTCS